MKSIESVILTNLISREDYGRKVLPFLREEYFRSRPDQVIFNLSKTFIDTYNTFPTKEALHIEAANLKNLSEGDFKAVKEKIDLLSFDSDTDVVWLLDQTERFCQEKAVENGIMASIEILDGKDKRMQVEPDMARRVALAREAQLIVARELPILPLHQPLIPWAMRRNVTAWVSPVNTLFFHRVRLD